MLKMIRAFLESWSGWIGDRDLEIAIRSELSRKGWSGAAAKFSQFRLVAIRRPGWLQIFSFDVTWKPVLCGAKQPGSAFGLVRQDERYHKLDIELFASASSRDALLHQWSDGMLRLRK